MFRMPARHRNSAGRRIEPARGGCYPKISMSVAMSATATPATAGTHRRVMAATGASGGKDGKFLGQFLRPAVRAGGSLPIAGADEDFAVALAFFAMEFVNRHGGKYYGAGKFQASSNVGQALTCPPAARPSASIRWCGIAAGWKHYPTLRRQFFAVRLVVAVPADQGGVTGIFKKKSQRRRFDMAVAKHHVGFALMTSISPFRAAQINFLRFIYAPQQTPAILNNVVAAPESVANRHHFTWTGNLRLAYWRSRVVLYTAVIIKPKVMSAQSQ